MSTPDSLSEAHPRSRGENPTTREVVELDDGSSPLTRGKRGSSRYDRRERRLIPAHAGKTKPAPSTRAPVKAHPRSRGENVEDGVCVLEGEGSSPLTRGKPGGPRRVPARRRLIPAHAGKTVNTLKPTISVPAHPRSRGENAAPRSETSPIAGSSPLTRGKRVLQGDKRVQVRLIPAHAGKTYGLASILEENRAHPRSRGENLVTAVVAGTAAGSSPLTRGKPSSARTRTPIIGLIPAHAGKTRPGTSCSVTRGAHPRSRGENTRQASPRSPQRGSSPLTRGKHHGSAKNGGDHRLIPAHAGKTR